MQNRNVIMRLVVVSLLLYSLASLASEYRDLRAASLCAQSLAAEAEQLRAEQEELTEKLDRDNWDEEMRRLAWERLGMVMPGEKIFYFVDDADTIP